MANIHPPGDTRPPSPADDTPILADWANQTWPRCRWVWATLRHQLRTLRRIRRAGNRNASTGEANAARVETPCVRCLGTGRRRYNAFPPMYAECLYCNGTGWHQVSPTW